MSARRRTARRSTRAAALSRRQFPRPPAAAIPALPRRPRSSQTYLLFRGISGVSRARALGLPSSSLQDLPARNAPRFEAAPTQLYVRLLRRGHNYLPALV